jgi:hypothetical protein
MMENAIATLFPPPMGGRARERGNCQRLGNHHQDTLQILQNIGVPKADYTETVAFQIGRTLSIAVRPRHMLTSVQLDNQATTASGKVGDIRTDRHLTAEFDRFKAFCPQRFPQHFFSKRWFGTQAACAPDRWFMPVGHAVTLSPPSPSRGRAMPELSYAQTH